MDGRGTVLGYFFGPCRDNLPKAGDVQRATAADAVLIALCGDLGLLKGDWPIVHASTDWDGSLWPLPCFARIDEHASKASRVEYAEATLQPVRETLIPLEQARQFPRDGLYGYIAVQTALRKLLSNAGNAISK